MVMELSEQAQVTNWPLRLLLTGATLVVILLALALLRRGWRSRRRRQGFALPPDAASAKPLRSGITGKYIGTVRAGDWLDRIVAGGAMARVEVSPTAAGLLLDREGEAPLLVPGADLREVGSTPGMLQKFYGKHGILTITWQWGDTEVVSGIWFADPQDHLVVQGWASDMLASVPGDSANEEDV